MSQTSPTLPPAGPEEAPKRRSPWPARVGIAVAVVVALGAGVGIGAAANSKTSQLNAANATISQQRSTIGQLQGKVGTLQGQVGTLQSQMSTLQTQLSDETNKADHALAVATAQVQAKDAARQAQLNSEAATLKSQQATLNQEIGAVQANQISSSGVYVVGKDIKSGTWHTNGDNGVGGNACYFATLGSTDTSNILDNNNFDGAETVDVSGAFAFEIDGPCTWVLVG